MLEVVAVEALFQKQMIIQNLLVRLIPMLQAVVAVMEQSLAHLVSAEVVDLQQELRINKVIMEIMQVEVLGMLHGMVQLAVLLVHIVTILVPIMDKVAQEVVVMVVLLVVRLTVVAVAVPSVVLPAVVVMVMLLSRMKMQRLRRCRYPVSGQCALVVLNRLPVR